MSLHLEWGPLNAWADGRRSATEDADERVHLAGCATCRAAVEALRALGSAARALPSAVEPPPELWRDIAATIAAGGATGGVAVSDTPIHAPSRTPVERLPGLPVASPARVLLPTRWLAAAAVVLMALSSGVTALLLRRDGAAPPTVGATGTPPNVVTIAAGGTPAALPASFTATEAAFLDDLAELQAAFVAQRHALAPATITVVERSLAAIDAAIAEARAALVADPANQALAELLSTTYRQKVELLRRAAESSQSS